MNRRAADTNHRGDIFTISHRGGVGFNAPDSHLKTIGSCCTQVDIGASDLPCDSGAIFREFSAREIRVSYTCTR